MIHANGCLRLVVEIREALKMLKNATCPEAYDVALEQDGIAGREEETVEMWEHLGRHFQRHLVSD